MEDAIMGPSTFRLSHLQKYVDASDTWLHAAGEVVDTSGVGPPEVARRIVDALGGA